MKKRQNISALFTIAVFYLILESVFGITCPILFLTGISCAGCGMSRAWFCVLRMDFTGAFRYHPLFWILPIGIMLFLFWDKNTKKDTEDLTYNCLCTIWGSIHLTNVGYGRFHRCLSAGKGSDFFIDFSTLYKKIKETRRAFICNARHAEEKSQTPQSFVRIAAAKLSPPHNSAENKTAETAYETTANTNAETAYGTKTSKTPETDRETFKNNTEDRFQTASAGDLDETKKFLQIGFFILAALCFVMAFRNLLSGIQNFSYSLIMQGLGNLLNMVCYAGIAAVLVMIALSKEKQRIKTFFVILSGLAAIIALCGIIEFITSMFRSFRYYFSFDTFFWILSSLLLTLTIMAAVVGITLYTPASLRIDTGFYKYHRSHRRICPQQSDIRNSTGQYK